MIRNAELCVELSILPFGLAKTQSFSNVITWFSSYVERLAAFPTPKTYGDQRKFTQVLKEIL